jgi:hypothetical protein
MKHHMKGKCASTVQWKTFYVNSSSIFPQGCFQVPVVFQCSQLLTTGLPSGNQWRTRETSVVTRCGSRIWGKRGRRALHIEIHGQFQRFYNLKNFTVNFTRFFANNRGHVPLAPTGSAPGNHGCSSCSQLTVLQWWTVEFHYIGLGWGVTFDTLLDLCTHGYWLDCIFWRPCMLYVYFIDWCWACGQLTSVV